MNRKELLAIMLAHSPLYISADAYELAMQDWDIEPLYLQDGNPYLIFAIKGPEFHFVKPNDKVSITASDLKMYPGSLIEKHGHATTKTPHDDKRQQRFNERLGFYRTGEDSEYIHYKIEKMRKSLCH
jgi:hypothetical protein